MSTDRCKFSTEEPFYDKLGIIEIITGGYYMFGFGKSKELPHSQQESQMSKIDKTSPLETEIDKMHEATKIDRANRDRDRSEMLDILAERGIVNPSQNDQEDALEEVRARRLAQSSQGNVNMDKSQVKTEIEDAGSVKIIEASNMAPGAVGDAMTSNQSFINHTETTDNPVIE